MTCARLIDPFWRWIIMKTIASVDVGYGNTKYTTKDQGNSYHHCCVFPSIATPYRKNHITGGIVNRRKTVLIQLENNTYEVGPEIERAAEYNNARPLHDNYTGSPEYKALALGAIKFSGHKKIDLLMTGLPISLLNHKANEVKSILEGSHTIEGKTIDVNEVKVIAQPLGGFINFAFENGLYGKYRDITILVIDVGYHTTDWITTTGINIQDARSGSHSGGMNMILKAMAEKISCEHNIHYDQLNTLDASLAKKRLHLNGRYVNPNGFVSAAEPYIEQTINAIKSTLGTTFDIEQIILIGGGSSYFSNLLSQHFPGRYIHIDDKPIFSNVRGYQRLGAKLIET